MVERRYLNFDLRIERAEQGYRARVVTHQGGRPQVEFTRPFSDQELQEFFALIGHPRPATVRDARRPAGSSKVDTVKDFGGRLFQTVFHGEVLSAWRTSLQDAQRRKAGLRIRLHLVDVPELADFPWEYLYDATSNVFLAVSTKTPLVRFLDLGSPMRPLDVKPPLRVLVMVASPRGYPQLDAEQELHGLRSALHDLMKQQLVVLDPLERATWDALQRKLQRETYHIFHFIGHGDFDEQAGKGVLLLEDHRGREHRVSGEDLMTLLHDHDSLQLAILNACEGARPSPRTVFAGTAQRLVQQGIPAVIAMQFNITDRAAITMAAWFYRSLANGFPVDAALAEARKAMRRPDDAEGVEWGTPVLYMHAPDGRIFDIERVPESQSVQRVSWEFGLGKSGQRDTQPLVSPFLDRSEAVDQPLRNPIETLYPGVEEPPAEPPVQIRMELLTRLREYQKALDSYVRGYISIQEKVDWCAELRSQLEPLTEQENELIDSGNWKEVHRLVKRGSLMRTTLTRLVEAAESEEEGFGAHMAEFDDALGELKELVRNAMRATMRSREQIEINALAEIARNAYWTTDTMHEAAHAIADRCKAHAREVLRELDTLIGRIDEHIQATRVAGVRKTIQQPSGAGKWVRDPGTGEKRLKHPRKVYFPQDVPRLPD